MEIHGLLQTYCTKYSKDVETGIPSALILHVLLVYQLVFAFGNVYLPQEFDSQYSRDTDFCVGLYIRMFWFSSSEEIS